MLSQRYTWLPKSQQVLVSILLGAFVLMLLNSAFLLLFDRSTAATYMSMVFAHVGVGVLLMLPVVVFLVLHVLKMPIRYNRRATLAGIFTATSAVTLFGTGVLMVAAGASVANGWGLWIHIASTVTTVGGFATHVSLKRGVRYHFLEWIDNWKTGAGETIQHPFSITVIVGFSLIGLFLLGVWAQGRTPTFLQAQPKNDLSPSQSVLAHKGFLEGEDLMRSETCGQGGCHPDIYEQWNESAHHLSSFNNKYYRETIELMEREGKGDEVRWCASCHDSAVLFTGGMHNTEVINKDTVTAQAGLTCLSCHSIQGLRDVKGNGRYVMAKPDEYPFARSESKLGKWLHNTLVRAKPEPHREAMLKPMHQTAEFCGTCHKVSIPPEVNDYRWKRGQDQYDSWHLSGVSGNTVRSFYLPDTPKNCSSCHMPRVRSDDQGNDGGFVKSHRFATANTALPMLEGHKDQYRLVKQALQDSVVVVDIFRVKVNGTVYGPEEKVPVLEPGNDVELTVVVRTRKVGHVFPAGTNDSNELWIELLAQDEQSETVLSSGYVGPDHYVDSTAHFFGALLVDEKSQAISKRDVQNWHATVYKNTIPPGAARTVHYRFKVPADASIGKLTARLKYRKFKQQYHEWVFRDRPEEKVPVLPIVTMAEDIRSVRKKNKAARPLWQRWNDYGIGLFLEGNMQGAVAAFRQVTEIAAENPEGPINEARVYLNEGQLGQAEKALAEAEKRRPGYLKTAYFRGLLYKALGEYDKAIDELERVVNEHPEDRIALRNIGRMHYLSGRYKEALQWFDRVLTIDPEDLGAIYNRMLTLGAMGRTKDYKEAQQRYQYHKEDEEATEYTAQYKKKHPMANREAQSIHYHGVHQKKSFAGPERGDIVKERVVQETALEAQQ